MARNVKFEIRRGAGSSLEVLFGKVSLTPTMLHTVTNSVVLPAPTTFDLVNGIATATNVAPSPAPVAGQVPWAYRVKISDNHGKTFEYLVGVPDGTSEINFNVLPRYFETKPPLFGKGEQGVPGSAATIALGNVTSGPTPSVTNTGTSTEAVLNFTLAKGDKGDKGEPGVSSEDWANAAANSAAAAEASKQAAIAASQLVDAPSDEVVRGLVASPTTLTYGSVRNAVRDVVSDVSPESTTDVAVKGLIETEGTLTNTALSAAIGEQAVLRGELVVNVRDYGAVGDGAVDDTASVQAAMDALGVAGGGTLYFPPGEYYLNTQVNLVSNITITGSGATISKKGGSARYVVFAGSSGTQKGYGAGPSNIICHGLTFKGQFGVGGRGICAFALHHSENVLVYGCRFTEAAQGGHRFDLQGSRRITIRDNVFEGFDDTDPAAFYNEDIQLDYSARLGLSFDEPSDLCFDGLGCEDIVVTGNRWIPLTIGGTAYPAGNPIGSHGAMENMRHRRIWFTDNEVGPGIADVSSFINGRIHLISWSDVVIRGNHIDGGGKEIAAVRIYTASRAMLLADVANGAATTAALATHYVCENIKIEGNHITGFSTSAVSSVGVIHSEATTGNTFHKRLQIIANTFRANKYNGDAVPNDGQNLIHITNAEAVSVSGNDAKLQRRMVNFKGVVGGTISSNRVSDSSNNVLLVGTSTHIDVLGNTIDGLTGSPAIIVGGGSLCRIRGNRVLSTSSGVVAIRVNASSGQAVIEGNTVAGIGVTLSRGIELAGTTTGAIVKNNITTAVSTAIYLEAGSSAVVNSGNDAI